MLKKTKAVPRNVNLLFLQIGYFWENIGSLDRKLSLIFINYKKVKSDQKFLLNFFRDCWNNFCRKQF